MQDIRASQGQLNINIKLILFLSGLIVISVDKEICYQEGSKCDIQLLLSVEYLIVGSMGDVLTEDAVVIRYFVLIRSMSTPVLSAGSSI